MQKLWSRAIQTSSCRCPACRSSTPGIARKGSTATAGRRLGKVCVSSTLFYSTVFAAAAVADARVKRERRQQWDDAIQRVKDTGLDGSSQKTREGDTQDRNESIKEALIPVDTLGVENEPGVHGNLNLPALSYQVSLDSTLQAKSAHHSLPMEPLDLSVLYEPINGESEPPINMGESPRTNNHLPPQSIYAGEVRQDIAGRRRHTPKKIQTLNLSIERLVVRALLYFKIYDYPGPALEELPSAIQPFAALPRSSLLSMLQNLEDRHQAITHSSPWTAPSDHPPNFSTPSPSFQQPPTGSSHHAAHDLNTALNSLFEPTRRARPTTSGLLPLLETLIPKLAHNLLVSSSPPDITTYNILLSSFANLRCLPLFDITLDSLLETHTRPNEVTCTTVLKEYIRQGNAASFAAFVRLMRGMDTGLMLARRGVRINEASRGRLVEKPESGWIVGKEGEEDGWARRRRPKVVQKPNPDPNVFGAVMGGMLKFAGLDATLKLYGEMVEEGWGLDVGGLTIFLKDCTKRKDWMGGKAIWARIGDLREREGQRNLVGRKRRKEMSKVAYHSMLSLCRSCDQQQEFFEVYRGARDEGYTSDELLSLSTDPKWEDWNAVDEMKKKPALGTGKINAVPDPRKEDVVAPLPSVLLQLSLSKPLRRDPEESEKSRSRFEEPHSRLSGFIDENAELDPSSLAHAA